MKTTEALCLGDIISRQVQGVAPDCSLGNAATTMARARVSCLVVMRDRHPMGLITEHDLIKLLHEQTSADTPVAEVMQAPIITAPVDLDFRSAFALMRRHHIRHLVVLANDGQVAGIATTSDFRTHISLDLFRSLENLQSVLEPATATLPAATPLAAVLEQMALAGLEYVLATAGGTPVGILTERDIPRLLGHGVDTGQTLLSVVMSQPLQTLTVHVSVAEAAERMARYRVRQLPVISDQGALIGVVSQTRLLEKLGIGFMEDLRLEQARLNRDRRLAEEDAAQQRANLSALFAVLSDFLFVLDGQGDILHYNPVVETGLGYGSALIGQPLVNLRPPERRQEAEGYFREILSGRRHSCTLPFLKADGTQIMVDCRVRRIVWSGEPAFVCLARDVSDECAAQAALRDSEIRFRTLFETAYDGMLILRKGQVVDCNAKALDLYGCKREEIIGTTPDQWSPPRQPDGQDSQSKANALIAAALAGQPQRFEWRHSHPDGSVFDTEVALNAVQLGDETLVQAIVHDITEQKGQQAELVEALRFLDESQAIAKVGGWKANPLTDQLRWTREVYRLVEHPLDHPPAGLEEGLQYYAPDSRLAVLAALAQSLETGDAFKLECRMLTRTGREFWAELRCSGRLDDPQEGAFLTGTFQDITDRKQMEHALQVSEATLKRAQAVAHTGSWFLDCTSNRLGWSDETYRIFGLEAGTPVDFETFLARVHADDRQPVIEAWSAALAGAPYDLQYRLTGCADRWVRERAEILFAPHGPPLTALGTVQDISERVQAENALKESYLLLQTILEALPIRVFWKDREGHYLGCNTAFAQDAGVTGPADLVGKDDFQLGWRDQAELYRADDFAVMASGLPKPPYEEPQTTPDGQTIWLRTAKVPLRDSQGDIFGILGIYEDVSPERHMREALRTSQERLALALQGANDGLWDLNLATGTTYYSPRWLEMLGYREGELPTTQEAWQRLVHPDDLPRVKAALAAYLEKRIGRYEVELRMRHREGHWVSILSRAILARDEQGHYIQPQRLVGTHVDISERKRFEHDLEIARSAAESANVAKSQFLANMSHEIRTPLNAILGLTQILQRETQDAGHHDVLGKIGEAGNSLLHIINDILDFSKIEAGQLRIAPHPFELGALLTRLESLFTPTAHQKGITLSIRGPANLGDMLDGDATRLEQVLINLIGNAVKFTETGKVAVRVNALAVDRRQARLRFTVADTGIGIAPEALANLFQPFTQAEAGITRRFGGTGLGLSISKRLVELMGGTIGVDSTLGQGSTFWFELTWPRVARDAPNAPAPAIQPELRGPRLQGLRVLAVDDNRINLFMLERALQLEGVQVHLAADGQQALQTLAASPRGFDVVLMDIQMPVMDGLTATRAIRQNPELAALPVIALTAGVLAEERTAAQAAGMTDFLPKPLDLGQMVAVLTPYVPVPAATYGGCRTRHPYRDPILMKLHR